MLRLVWQYYDPIQTSNPISTAGINWCSGFMLIDSRIIFNLKPVGSQCIVGSHKLSDVLQTKT
jgi:hypothetical protein